MMSPAQKVDLLLHEMIDTEAQILQLMIDNHKATAKDPYQYRVETFDLLLEKSLNKQIFKKYSALVRL